MPEAYQIILLFVAVFGAAFGFACLIKFGGNYVKEKMSDAGRKKDDIPAPAYEPDPKIYYIRNADCKPAAPKKPRKKAKRKPDLAFKNIKGIVIKPEEFCEKKYR